MILIKVLITLCLIRRSLQMVGFYEEEPTPVSQLGCVNTALKRYLETGRNIGIFLTNSSSPLNSLLRVPSTIFTQWNSLREGFSIDTKAVVIFLEGNADKDLNGLERLQEIYVDILSPVLIVCITDVVCSSEMYMKKIAKNVNIPELHYVAVDDRGIIDIYEYTTRSEGRCGIPELSRLGHCSGKSGGKKIFERPMNFHECPMRVVAWTYPPYSIPCGSDYRLNQLCGLSGAVVHVLCNYLNATPVLLTVESPEDLRLHIANGDADLGFGELDARPYVGVSYTGSYLIVKAVLVARPSIWSLEQSLGNIVQPLEFKVWLGIGVVTALIFILRRLVPCFRKIDLLQHFGMCFGNAVARQPRRLPTRIYFLSLVIFGYLCSQSYLANLTRVLTAPDQPMIKTLSDLENSGLRVAGTASQKEKFQADYPRIYNDFQVINDSAYFPNLYQLLEADSDLIYYIEDTDRNIAQWQTIEALQDTFNWFPIVLAVPNSSAIMNIGNEIVIGIFESGIMNAHVSLTSPTYHVPQYRDPPLSEQAPKLELHDLKDVFWLLIIGLSISFSVFLIEILIAVIKNKQKFNEGGRTDLNWSRQRGFHRMQIPKQTFSTRKHRSILKNPRRLLSQ